MPPGWPPGVHPPGSADFERTAVAWLLDVVPADYRLYGVLRRYPLALAAMATHHADACVAGTREAYRKARTELGDVLPAHGLDAVLAAYRTEGRRLVVTARAVDLVSRALRGEVFAPRLAETRRQDSADAAAEGAGAGAAEPVQTGAAPGTAGTPGDLARPRKAAGPGAVKTGGAQGRPPGNRSQATSV